MLEKSPSPERSSREPRRLKRKRLGAKLENNFQDHQDQVVPNERRIMERLRELRKRRGLSQMELAKRSGTAQYTISSIELGRRKDPHPSTLRKLANALNIPVSALWEELEETEDDPKAEAPSQPELSATGSAIEEERSTATALIAALRTYFWDMRFRWKEPGNKPTPTQIRDALNLLQHLVTSGAFEGPLTPREENEVALLFNAAHKLRPIAEELAEEDEATWLKPMIEDVYEEVSEVIR
jgi:transcriptional regulator with XRE-family HTH domain